MSRTSNFEVFWLAMMPASMFDVGCSVFDVRISFTSAGNRMKRKRKLSVRQRRALRRRVIQLHRPWEKSTGPKTMEGKQVSRLNALKHGLFSVAGAMKGFFGLEG
jgi:hypothetical protein